jgi:Na+/H+-translocating membrane pyrophosphatase
MDHGLDNWFDINPVSIGLPALITAIIGLLITGGMVYTISLKPTRLEENGDPNRKEMSDMVEKLGKVINRGATTFLLKEYTYLVCVALSLFVLVSAAVNWRTGIW